MGTLRTSLLPAIDAIRNILGPQHLDLRPTSITIVQRVWSGPRRGVGTATDTPVTSLPSWVKVRHVTQREIDGSGGRYEEGDVIIGPITPQFTTATGTTGGFTEAQLAPSGQEGVEIVYVLALQAGASGIAGEYQLVDFKRDRAFRFMLVVGRRRTSPRVTP